MNRDKEREMKRFDGHRRRIAGAVIGVLAVGVLAVGCVSTGGDTFEEFQSAIDGRAPCEELFDQRSNFDNDKTLERIDKALAEIGCDDRNSERTDI